MTDLTPKPIRTSRISLAQMMQPEHANNLGNVHGGWIMKLVDEAGALACMRHSQCRVVTVAIDSMSFRHPIKTSDVVILNAEVSYTGTTSIEAEVQVIAENPLTGQRWQTNTAYLLYVALDDAGKPTKVPPIFAETIDEERKLAEARERQKRRLEQRK
jgi:acyl-CoA hydrolase